MSRAIALDAPGKVNLVLRVLHRRPDGYRELETVFQMVSLADRVELTLSEGPGAVTLSVDGPDLGPVESNLAWRAAEEFRLAAGLDAGVHIALTKKIPAGAGLGGGSSDAAAVLRGLARLTGFDDPLRLHGIARSLGADVPFFLGPAPIALGRGRGDELTPLQALPEADLVLALPRVHVSTVDAYRSLPDRHGDGNAPDASAHPGARPDEAFLELDWPTVVRVAENDFQPVVSPRVPAVRASIEALSGQGALLALLSGSGGASFGVFEDRAASVAAAEVLTDRHGWPFVPVTTLAALPDIERLSPRG